jgi:hypothetical protein
MPKSTLRRATSPYHQLCVQHVVYGPHHSPKHLKQLKQLKHMPSPNNALQPNATFVQAPNARAQDLLGMCRRV